MNGPTDLGTAERQLTALHALERLGRDRDGHALLRVRCGRGHRVATVFATTLGAVYESRVGGHAHGRRDFVDEPHRTERHGRRYIDLLAGDRFAADRLPASCECGPHELSRADLRRAVGAHQRLVQLV
ncbi:hypothetical protein [Nocardia sp. alder85J]|uniref:hypothetical protein n=1 Tax=Nocardia sp. alder85J TaxID=2862949 RepID=UPI001CD4B6A4|nr:hypothetical protein [Nocardia sp. alder85J]MCX4095857.1 hypothetical protein [Nocardia sp. alder85J]